jgi:hypothetical protein
MPFARERRWLNALDEFGRYTKARNAGGRTQSARRQRFGAFRPDGSIFGPCPVAGVAQPVESLIPLA